MVQGILFLNLEKHCETHGHNEEVGGDEPCVAYYKEELRWASQAEVRQSGQKWAAKQEKGKKGDIAVLGFTRFIDTRNLPFSLLQ